MAELYLFDQNDKFINILTEDEGLVDTWFKDYQNHVEDESFVFNVKSNSPLLKYVIEENQVAFYDRDDRLRLARMKDLSEVTTSDNGAISHEIRVICEPSFLELHDHFIEDRRITDGTAQTALNRALEGSRYIGEVTVDLGLATDNFYWIDGIEAVFKILETWGGALKDTITLDDNNEIIERKLWIVQRLGTDNGLIVEPDYNAETISRNTLSYPETALWGQGSSLEIEDDEGELTGGHTRYITFEDVEWKVSDGDPVDKPKGQKWVGDPDALARDGYLDNGTRKHRFGHFSNQDYEDPEELLWATWQELQERKLKEIMHEATIYESDKKVGLGDTVTILDRNYNKPIELQSQITGLEYDILYPDDEIKIVVGKYIDMNEDPLQKEVDDLKEDIRKPRPTKPIDNGSFPDIEPGTPVNVEAHGAFQTIQLFWDYDSNVYISHYEVYGSQISDFVPDEQQLLYRGRVSAFSHEVPTDEMWYYYVRAVNTRGTEGEFSNRVSASSIRIINDDILFGSIIADHLSDGLDIADKLAQNTIDRINEGPMQAIEYTQEEIEDAENRILGKLNNEIGDVNTAITDLLDRTSEVEGTVTNVKTDIDTINGEISATIEELTNLDDIVSQQTLDIQANSEGLRAKAEKSEVYTRTATDSLLGDKVNVTTYENKMSQLDIDVSGISGRVSNTETNINDLTGDMSSAMSQIGELDVKANNINASVSEVRADLDGLEIGGRNLLGDSYYFIPNSNNQAVTPITSKVMEDEEDAYVRTTPGSDNIISTYYRTNGNRSYLIKDSVISGEEYTYSIYVRTEVDDDIRIFFRNNVQPYFTSKHVTKSVKAGKWTKISCTVMTTADIVDNDHLVLFLYSTKNGKYVDHRYPQLEKGNKATDWSPAPEDIDANFTDMRASLDLKADSAALEVVSKRVNQESGLLEDARASINILRSDISLKVDIDGVIGSINLSKEGVRIDGNKHHITGQTLIDDAVIGTSAIANLAVDRFHLKQGIIDNAHIADATIEHGKMKSLNVDQVVAGQMSLNYLKAGTIDTNKFTVRGGSATDYTLIDGSFFESRGRFTREWRGNRTTRDIKIKLENGYIRARNDTERQSLYFSDMGISTYADATGPDAASGTLAFRDYEYSGYAGVTLHSHWGKPAMESSENRVVIAPHKDTRGGVNLFEFAIKDNPSSSGTDGWIAFGNPTPGSAGNPASSGIRFKKSTVGTPTVYATNGNGDIGTGDFHANRFYGDLAPRGSYAYVRAERLRIVQGNNDNNYSDIQFRHAQLDSIRVNGSGSHLYLGTSSGEARVTNNERWEKPIGYRPIRASSFPTGSSEIYKSDIKLYEENALDILRDAVVYDYVKDGVPNRELGFIIEREFPDIIKHDDISINGYSHSSLNTKAIQELDVNLTTEVTRIDDRLNLLELENQYLKQKIKQLEGAA